MKMTKLLSLFLVLVFLTSLFTGCFDSAKEPNKEEASEERKSIINEETNEEEPATEGLVADITVQVEESWLEYYQKAANRVLEVNPDSTINFIVDGSYDHLDLLDSTDLGNEDIADVFVVPADRLYGMVEKETLAEIDALQMASDVGGFKDFKSGLGRNFNIDGRYFAFPMNIETLINFANIANAETNGIDLSSTVEFTELNNQDILFPVFNLEFCSVLMNAVNIELLNVNETGELYSDMTKDFSELTQDQQDMFKGLFNYWKTNGGSGDLWDLRSAWTYMDTEFMTGGRTSFRIEGPGSTDHLAQLASDGEALSVLPINQVTFNGNPLTQWKDGWGLAINTRNEGDEGTMLLSQAMIEEILNPEFAVEFYEASGKIMGNVDAIVYANSNLDEIDKALITAVIESYQEASTRPLIPEWGLVWGTWETAVLSWPSLQPATAEEAYAVIKASFEGMMKNF